MQSLAADSEVATTLTDAKIKRLLWQGPARVIFSIFLVFFAAGLYTVFPILRAHDVFYICLLLGLFFAAVWGFEDLLANNTSTAMPHQPSPPSALSGPLLNAVKEEIFQLEADRLQGKLNQREYQVAKGILDKTLQRAMKN